MSLDVWYMMHDRIDRILAIIESLMVILRTLVHIKSIWIRFSITQCTMRSTMSLVLERALAASAR